MDNSLISVCMIVRNEAARLGRCFASAADVVDEWVVLDTGSTDGTVDLARSMGAVVLEDPWRDDFAHSRNLSLEPARGEWILILDGDDVLIDGEGLRAFLTAGPAADALYLQVRSQIVSEEGREGWETFWQPRVFRRSAGIRYRYPMHAIPVLQGCSKGPAPGRIDHLGYVTAEARRAKAARSLRIMKKLPADDPHRAYQELRAHAILQDWAAIDDQAAHLRRVQPAMPPDAWTIWAQALLVRGHPVDAAARALEGLQHHPDHPDLFHALMSAGGIGYVGAARTIQRRGGLYDGLALTLSRVPETLAALVDLGVLRRDVLDTDLATFGRDGFLAPAAEPPPPA